MKKPEILPNPDYKRIENIAESYLTFFESPEYHDDNDYRHYIYETVMASLYGETIWEYINAKNNNAL